MDLLLQQYDTGCENVRTTPSVTVGSRRLRVPCLIPSHRLLVCTFSRPSLQYCAKKQAKLEEERTVNAELIQSVADLTRSRAEVLRELEALKAKLRSLEVNKHNNTPKTKRALLYLSLFVDYVLFFWILLDVAVRCHHDPGISAHTSSPFGFVKVHAARNLSSARSLP